MLLESHNNTALVRGDERISYDDLLAIVDGYSRQMPTLDMQKVVVFAENRLEWVYAFYAGLKQNSTMVPIDFMCAAEDVAYILKDCQPALIFCSIETKPVLEQAMKLAGLAAPVLVLDDLAKTVKPGKSEPIPMPDISNTMLLIYTSGTTGSPKGVMLSCDNLLANIEAVSETVPIFTPDQRVIAFLPLHHIFPLLGAMMAPLYTGGTTVFPNAMTAEDMIDALHDHQVTILIGVPRLYSLIHKSIMDKVNANRLARVLFGVATKLQSPKFSKKIFAKLHDKFGGHIRHMVSGGAKLDETVGADLTTLGFEILEGFGMTEAAPMITFTRPGQVRIGSPGPAMACNEIKIVDGEVTAKGRNIMQGYYKRPVETAEVLKDGWLYTGDLGFLDDDGYLHITGRKKEIIILPSGKNINPAEIENKLLSMHPVIGEAAVFLLDDRLQVWIIPDFAKARKYEIGDVEAFIKDQIILAYNEKASPYKKIMKLNVRAEELPRTRLGKLKRFMLADLVQDKTKTIDRPAEPSDEDYQTIRSFLHAQKKQDVFVNDHLELDLGLDSLDFIELQAFIDETFGIDVREQALMNHPTVGKLATFVGEHKIKQSTSSSDWGQILEQATATDLPGRWFGHNGLRYVLTGLGKLYFKQSTSGIENMPLGPCIFAPNHQSFLDAMFVTGFMNALTFNRTYFFAKQKHLNSRLLRAFADNSNVVVIDLDQDLKLALQKLAVVLRGGGNLVIFPEGTRSKDGKLAAFRKSYAILSKELNVPVVPIAISGAWDALPKGAWLPKPGAPIGVDFLPPIEPTDHSVKTLNEAVRDAILDHLNKP